MCRWLAYTGEPLQPSTLILDAKHSVVAMSLNSPLGAETVNGDGFGFGWYPGGRRRGATRRLFRSIEPAWNDENLREITHAVDSPLFFTHVRAAGGPPIQQTNCHPFRHENWLFMHNGVISQFATHQARPHVRGRSVAVPAHPRHHRLRGALPPRPHVGTGRRPDPRRSATRSAEVEEAGHKAGVQFPMQGTIAVSDGETLWAFRYSSQGQSRTLFHSADIPTLARDVSRRRAASTFGDHAQVVVSEPLNDLPGAFLEVPESTVAILDPAGYRHEPFLAA